MYVTPAKKEKGEAGGGRGEGAGKGGGERSRVWEENLNMFLTEITFSFSFSFFPHQRETLTLQSGPIPQLSSERTPGCQKFVAKRACGSVCWHVNSFVLTSQFNLGEGTSAKCLNRKEKLPTLLFSLTKASRFKLKLPLSFSLSSSKNARFPVEFRGEGNFGRLHRCRGSHRHPGPQRRLQG